MFHNFIVYEHYELFENIVGVCCINTVSIKLITKIEEKE